MSGRARGRGVRPQTRASEADLSIDYPIDRPTQHQNTGAMSMSCNSKMRHAIAEGTVPQIYNNTTRTLQDTNEKAKAPSVFFFLDLWGLGRGGAVRVVNRGVSVGGRAAFGVAGASPRHGT